MTHMPDVLRNLLENIADRAEIERYLDRFSGVDPTHFGIVKVGGQVLRDDLEEVASALAFLHRVGLYPIVVHGAGPQLDDALAEAEVGSERIDGMRVTSEEVLGVLRKVINRVNVELVDALGALDVRARPIASGVFEASLLDSEGLGMVGEVEEVHLEPIEAAIRAGSLPIVACMGETAGGQIVNINADVAARALARAAQPHKLVFLTGTGGMLDDRGEIIPAINLAEDYERLLGESWVHGGMELKLKEIRRTLEDLPRTSSVSITSPEHLSGELFTDKGNGTLVRLGEVIEVHDDLTGLDTGRIHASLEKAFGRRVERDYFDGLDPHKVFIAADYSAVAILTIENGQPYLDKFAVTAESQGVGLGVSLWNRIHEETPSLFWRSRAGNPFNSWYFKKADGAWRSGDWVVFWYGIESPEVVAECRDHAAALTPTVAVSRSASSDDDE